MSAGKNRVCPVTIASSLDNSIRRWLLDPRKILGPYIKKGMTALDVGCCPGFFSFDLAQMVGKSGRIIASDLQEKMLQKLKLNKKIQGTELEERIYTIQENNIPQQERLSCLQVRAHAPFTPSWPLYPFFFLCG